MKTKIILFAVLLTLNFSLFTFHFSFSQNVGINTTGAIPNAATLLDLNTGNDFTSTGKGLLIPCMSTSARNAITSPPEGLLIYNTTTKCYEGYNATTLTWVSFGCIGCTLPAAPTTGTHTPSQTQIIWNWNTVSGATGYKWNTTNNYSTATDMGAATTKTETGLTCNTAYTRYVWAYNTCGNSSATTLTQTTSSCCPSGITAGNTTTGTGSLCIGGSNLFTINAPAGVSNGNVLIAGITQNGSASSVIPPSGWTFIASNTGNGPNYIYYKVAGASEPPSYTWTFDIGTYPSGVITNFTGTFCDPPLDAYSTVNTSGYTASSITTSMNNEMLVVVFCSGNGANTWSTPAGMTAGYSGGQNCTSTAIFYGLQASAGATGTKTGTPGISDTGSAYLIALH